METAVEVEMKGLGRAVEWLRPFLEQHGWDYCVVWKLNDDPSRFVEFVDCCCVGGNVFGAVKVEENGDQIRVMPVCRDFRQEHQMCTRACETLGQIPATMSLYSGIHTDVALTNQPMWLSKDDATLVLIPLEGGLIELFAAKIVDKDQEILDFILYQYNTSLEHYAMDCYLNPSVDDDVPQETQSGKCLQNSSPGVFFIDPDTTPRLQIEPAIRGQTHACFPGSSSGSNPSLDGSCFLSQVSSLPPSSTNSPCSKKPKFSEDGNFSKPQSELVSTHANAVSERGYPKSSKHAPKEGSKAKNLEVERKRRNRIKDGEFQLRALVPNITKMDRASIISDAIDYIIQLKKTVKELEDELKNDDHGDNADQGTFNSKQKIRFEYKNSEVKVEVREICERNFVLRIEVEQQPSGFPRVMEVLSSVGLQIEDVNITSCHGLVLGNFRVEADREFEQNQLREALVKGLCAASAQEVG